MKVNQKDAVFNAVSSYAQEHGIEFGEGTPVQLDKGDRQTLIGMLATGLEAGEIEVKPAKAAKMAEEGEKGYREYAANILNNWTRKDTRLNGGEPYETKRPGSRAGSGDEVIKELRKLKSTLTDQAQIDEVDGHIEARLEEIRKEKVKEVKIDVSILPDSLKHLVNS